MGFIRKLVYAFLPEKAREAIKIEELKKFNESLLRGYATAERNKK